jgi:hypothetical protein
MPFLPLSSCQIMAALEIRNLGIFWAINLEKTFNKLTIIILPQSCKHGH